jgi:hypothetical protein
MMMDLPRRYPYNPKRRPIAIFFAAGCGMFALAAFHAAFWICAPVGAGFVILGLLGIVRCFVLRRFLELGQDAILLPTGFLHRRTTKISYADIDWTQEARRRGTPVLRIGAKGRTFEFSPQFLLDMASFVAVRDFLTSLPGPKEKAITRQNQPTKRGQYCFQCSY